MAEYSYRQRSRARELQRKRRKILVGMVLIAILLIVGVIALIKQFFFNGNSDNIVPEDNPVISEEQGLIEDGVFIDSVAVGGMDYEQVSSALADYADKLGDISITIDVNDNKITTVLSDIGLVCDTEASISDAFAMENAGKVNLGYDIDRDKLDEFLDEECTKYTIKPKNAKISRVNGEFVIKRGKMGLLIDNDATAEAVLAAVNAALPTGTAVSAKAVMYEKEPQYTSEDMQRCRDVLGKFSTSFHESQIERSANLRNAAGFIDGTVLYPGDVMSVADTIYPLSADNGYKEAPSYADGQVVDSLGGGVCQVSTTLYNAVIRAELEVVARSPHSMVVSYVEPSMDAAIAGDYKDLKFKNNTDTPIYIQSTVSGGVITFTIYGHETRPASRTIDFESVKVETIEPGNDVVTKDPTQPEGYEKETQSAHVGYVANLFKIVYENGVEVSRDKINYSKYNAEPRYVTIGTKKVKDKDKDKKKDKDKAKPTNDPEEEDDDEIVTEPPAEQDPGGAAVPVEPVVPVELVVPEPAPEGVVVQ